MSSTPSLIRIIKGTSEIQGTLIARHHTKDHAA